MQPRQSNSISQQDVTSLKFHLHRDSVVLEHVGDTEYELNFKIDTQVACHVDIHFAAVEITNDLNEFLYFYTDPSLYPAPQSTQVVE